MEAWKRAYEQLNDCSMQQFMLVKDAAGYDEQLLSQVERLSAQKTELQREIERIQDLLEREVGADRVKDFFQRHIRDLAESARLLTFETARKIELMMLSKGSELGGMKARRKAFQAYSGMDYDDQVAMYFDEKK